MLLSEKIRDIGQLPVAKSLNQINKITLFMHYFIKIQHVSNLASHKIMQKN